MSCWALLGLPLRDPPRADLYGSSYVRIRNSDAAMADGFQENSVGPRQVRARSGTRGEAPGTPKYSHSRLDLVRKLDISTGILAIVFHDDE